MQPAIFSESNKPLWAKVRPTEWKDYLDISKLHDLRKRFLSRPFSFLLHGPPGVGKTTFVEILLKESGLRHYSLAAASTSLEELRKIIHTGDRVILFMDEFHRFSKARQDFFLKPIEDGEVILIAATTESPWYYLTSPLMSRLVIREIKEASKEQFLELLTTNLARSGGQPPPPPVIEAVAERTRPDVRRALQAVEYLSGLSDTKAEADLLQELENFLIENHFYRTDQQTELYDHLSALIKSIRGSDVDSSVLYLAKLLSIKADPMLVARRLLVSASEDIGLANSQALVVASAGAESVLKTGMPEARIILSHVVIYLACSPKSNAAYLAIQRADEIVKNNKFEPPDHLKNRPGAAEKYKSPHDYEGFVEQNYWPEAFTRKALYETKPGIFSNSLEHRIEESRKELKKKRN